MNTVRRLSAVPLVLVLAGCSGAATWAHDRETEPGDEEIGVSVVALAECAHVLRTQYGIAQRDILDSLNGLVQRENVRVTDARGDILVARLVRARDMPGRPIPR